MKFQIVIPLCLICVLFIACADSENAGEQNLMLIERYVSAVENMEYEGMDSFFSDNYLGIGPSHRDSITKAGAVASWKYNVENLYEKIEYKNSRNIAVTVSAGDGKGHWVSNWAELTIDYKDNGGSVTIYSNSLYKIEKGKISKSFTLYNEADALRQLGYVFIRQE